MITDIIWLLTIPLTVFMLLGVKVLLAIYVVDYLTYGKECMIYSIYFEGRHKFSTTIEKDAKSFYQFMTERYGKLAVRLETIKV